VRIELAGDNTLAPISMEARAADGAPWRVLAQATAFRLHSGEDVLRNEDIALTQPMPLREWRL